VILVDDAPGSELGCGDNELVTIYSQRLDSTERTQLLPADVVVKAERVELSLQPTAELETFSWTDYCEGERRATWTGQLAEDAQSVVDLVRLGTFTLGGVDDPVFGDIRSSSDSGTLATTGDGNRALLASPELSVVEADGAQRCQQPPKVLAASDDVAQAAVWAPNSTTVAVAFSNKIVLWDCVAGTARTLAISVADGRLMFDATSSRLVVQTSDASSQPQITLVTFR